MARSLCWTKATGLVVLGIVAGWVIPSQQTSNAKTVRRVDPPRIAYVNIAKVLQQFERSNQEEAKINERKADFEEKINAERDILSQLNMHYQASDDPTRKKELQEQALATMRRIEAIDDEATKELLVLTNNKSVAVYEQVREIAAELAKERGLDVVEGFPSAATQKEERSPKISQLTLQAPAIIPLYLNPDLDFTAEVIARLNKKFPPELGNKPAK
jgi:Skp family chaperone for outer membrane proteins